MFWKVRMYHFAPKQASAYHWVTWVALLLLICGYFTTFRRFALSSFYLSVLNLRSVPQISAQRWKAFLRDYRTLLLTRTEDTIMAKMASLRGGVQPDKNQSV
jgi:hypothetical protein